MKIIFTLLFVFQVFIASINLSPSTSNTSNLNPIELSRLIIVCKLWGKIKFFHPYLAYKDIDWDKALIDFFKSDYKLDNDKEFVKKVDILLRSLDDPVTRVIDESLPSNVKVPPKSVTKPIFKMAKNNFLVVNIKNAIGHGDFYLGSDSVKDLESKFSLAEGIIFDFRRNGTISNYNSVFYNLGIYKKLFSGNIFSPCIRYRMHWGYTPEIGSNSGGYYSSFNILEPIIYPGSGNELKKPIVFLVNDKSRIPQIALALQAAGKAAIVAENGVDESFLIRSMNVQITESSIVRIRTSEILNSDDSIGVNPDVLIEVKGESSEEDAALIESFKVLRNFKIYKKNLNLVSLLPKPQIVKKYTDAVFPNENSRLLALFKAWNVFEHFFPYKDLMDRDWDDVLKEFIPKIINVKNEIEYALTISEMLTHLYDSHIGIYSEGMTKFFGSTFPPFGCRMIEGQPVVDQIFDDEIIEQKKLLIGNIILEIDGENIFSRLKRLSKYFSASTIQSKTRKALLYSLRGTENSKMRLKVRGRDGKIREVEIIRKPYNLWKRNTNSQIKPYKLISKRIGYSDLSKLTKSMVDEMFEAFRDTKAIIFDMRGYPKGTAWDIAPRLTDKESITGAIFKGLIASPSKYSFRASVGYKYNQLLPKSDKWKYKGKTVMLINETTSSQAEHTCLFFEAANNTTFIGAPTAGTNGDVTNFFLPGNIIVRFTGQAVFHADGQQLQRKGIQPHIDVRPTIKGIQEGKDEVLERAIHFLKEEFKLRKNR